MAAHHKMGFDLYREAGLKSKALRQEIGQGEEADQTREMRDLKQEYNELRTTVYKQRSTFSSTCGIASFPKPFCCGRLRLWGKARIDCR